MSNQELRKHLDSVAGSPEPNLAVKTLPNDSHKNRAVIAVDGHGFRCDEDGVPHEYLSGHMLDPNTYDKNGARSRINIRYKNAEETAREKAGGGPDDLAKAASYFKHLANTTQSYKNRTPLNALGSMVHEDVVIAADFLTVNESVIVQDKSDPNSVPGKVMTAGINYAQIIANQNSDQDTEVKIGYATKVFNTPKANAKTGDGGRDISFVKEYTSGINVHLMTADDPRSKKQQRDIVEFIGNALYNKLPANSTQFPEEARRTGMIVIGGAFHVTDVKGNRKLDNRSEIYTELYADREAVGEHVNPITGRVSTVWEAGDPIKTLTKLVEGQDRNTVAYLKNPANPSHERKALEADYQRAILHAISQREAKLGEPLIIASQNEKNVAKVREVYDAAVKGDFQLRVTAGERREYFLKAGQEETDKARAIYNKVNPDNPTFRNVMIQPHISEFNMANYVPTENKVTGKIETRPSGIAVPMIIGIKSIDDPSLTKAPGSKLVQRITALDIMGVSARTPVFDPTNPNMRLLEKFKDATYTLGAGYPEKYKNQAVEQYQKENPLYPTPGEARAAFEKAKTLDATKVSENVLGVTAGDTMRTLDGDIAVPSATDVFANLINASRNTGPDAETAAKLEAATKAAEARRIQVSEMARQLQATLDKPEPAIEMVVEGPAATKAEPVAIEAEVEKPKAKAATKAKPKAATAAKASDDGAEKPTPVKRTRKAAVKATPAEAKADATADKPEATKKPARKTAAKPAAKAAEEKVAPVVDAATPVAAESEPAKRKRRKP